MYGGSIHLTIPLKREWSYGFKPDNKTVPLPCYLESPYDHQREVARRKLSLLDLAKELNNLSKACKLIGYSRQLFYEIRRNY